MNGNFWSHLVKAFGYAVVGGEDEDDAAERRSTPRRTNPYARKKGCCNAKRPTAGGSAGAPVPGAQFSGVRRVRSAGGNGSTEG